MHGSGQRVTYAFSRTAVMACSNVGARASTRSTVSPYVPGDRRNVAAAQAGLDEQGLPVAGEATPPGADLTAVTCEVLQDTAEQISIGRVGKHVKLPPDWRS